ncbi:hypothetical protein ACVBEQ_04205 [Nakamurella sp. GG22]
MTAKDRGPLGDGLDIETELRELRDLLSLPEPAAGTVSAVMARIDQEPLPTGSALRQRIGGVVEWLHNRWRAATVVAVGALLAVLAVSPAGAAIREWLGFGAVVVEQQQPASTPTTASGGAGTAAQGTEMTLEQARLAVSFPLVVPDALGEPDQLTVAADRRLVTMEWTPATGGPIRLDQIGGALSPYYVKKYYDDVTFTVVDGDEALWFARSHPIVILDPNGTERTESARESGPTLLWQRPGVTLRLEGIDDQRTAESIAESVRN